MAINIFERVGNVIIKMRDMKFQKIGNVLIHLGKHCIFARIEKCIMLA